MWGCRANIRLVTLLPILAMAWGCRQEPALLPVLDAELPGVTVQAPDSLGAGEALTLSFRASAALETPWTFVSNPWGALGIPLERNGEVYLARVPLEVTRFAGPLRWRMGQGNTLLASGVVEIQPSEKRPEVLESYAGPSHLRIGQDPYGDFIVLPVDVWDNPLPDGTALSLTVSGDGSRETATDRASHLMAYRRLGPGQRTGIRYLDARHGDIRSKRREVRVMAGIPDSLTLLATRPHDVADGHSLLHLAAGPLRDAWGNPVPDGTWVEFRLTDSLGNQTRTQGAALRGLAEIDVPFPNRATQWRITAAAAGGVVSRPLELAFLPAVVEVPFVVAPNGRLVEIGPVPSLAGGLAPDGFPVNARLESPEGDTVLTRLAWLRDGQASLRFPATEVGAGRYRLLLRCGDWQGETRLNTDRDGLE
ncbi:hypothetical protein OZ410_13625 [Robiginitalea sp. M366]|uniref:hypothetical protein n=1 Tax=Robiginitalea aestuariiviva TaxID=3036903 RepID=UPI00240D418E|nr:hypothetical protein [Robiginitalea aestuariiviva]MDG1573364.1 hypothetical protein [Robiginitalea aestuariiviva]